MYQINKKNFISVITIVLLVATVLLLFELCLRLSSMNRDLKAQGQKIAILYDFFDSQVNGLEESKQYLEEENRQRELDTKLALEMVNDFKSSNFTTKAKFNSKDNTFAVILGDGSIQILNAKTSNLVQTLRQENEYITSISYLPDGKQLVAGTNSGKLYLWNLETNQSKFIKQVGESGIARLDAAKNNRVAVGISSSYEESKKAELGMVIDISTGQILSKYPAFFNSYQGLALSSDGESIVIDEVHGKPRGACLFNASDGTELKLFYHENYGCGPLSVDIAADNKTVAVGYAPYHVIVWNVEEGTVKWLFEEHSNWVVSLDFSDDGKFLASGAGDSSARVYNLTSGKQVGCVRFPGSSTYVRSVDISADGNLLLAAVDSYIGVYKMPKIKVFLKGKE